MKCFWFLKNSVCLARVSFFLLLFLFFPQKAVFAQEPKNFAGVSVDPTNPNARPEPRQLSEMGIGMVRVVYRDDENTKNYIANLITAGITPVLVLNWEANDQAWYDSREDIANYSERFKNNVVLPAVQEYKNQAIYQIWNEPDGQTGTIPLTASQYYTILASAYEAIKGTTNAEVITAGLVSGDLNYIAQLTALSRNNLLPADGISYHPYLDDINGVRNGILTLANTTGLPVWITEFGLGTPDQQKQADWIKAVFNLAQDPNLKQKLQSIMWYAWSDAMKNNFGLVDASGRPKKELIAFLEAIFGGKLPEGFLDRFDFTPITPTPPPDQEQGIDWGWTRGEPFVVIGKEDEAGVLREAKEKIRRIILTYFETAKINFLASTVDFAFEKINLPQNPNLTSKNRSKGYVDFYYCQRGLAEWPRFGGTIEFDAPSYYKQAATATYQYGDMMTVSQTRAARSPLANLPQPTGFLAEERKDQGVIITEGSVLAESEQGFKFILSPSSCTASGGNVNCEINIKGSERYGHMWVWVNDQFVGINAVPGLEEAPNTYHFSFSCPAGNCLVTVRALNLDIQDHPTIVSSCDLVVGSKGSGSCSFEGAVPITPPPPPLCEIGAYDRGKGEIAKEPVPTRGIANVTGVLSILIKQIWRELKDELGKIIDKWEEREYDLKEYVVFPYISHPYTKASEIKFRQEVSLPFTLPGEGHNLEHAQTRVEYEVGNKNPPGSKIGTIYGSYGWNEAYEYDVKMVSPP